MQGYVFLIHTSVYLITWELVKLVCWLNCVIKNDYLKGRLFLLCNKARLIPCDKTRWGIWAIESQFLLHRKVLCTSSDVCNLWPWLFFFFFWAKLIPRLLSFYAAFWHRCDLLKCKDKVVWHNDSFFPFLSQRAAVMLPREQIKILPIIKYRYQNGLSFPTLHFSLEVSCSGRVGAIIF